MSFFSFFSFLAPIYYRVYMKLVSDYSGSGAERGKKDEQVRL
jgi:hypothetical protein